MIGSKNAGDEFSRGCVVGDGWIWLGREDVSGDVDAYQQEKSMVFKSIYAADLNDAARF